MLRTTLTCCGAVLTIVTSTQSYAVNIQPTIRVTPVTDSCDIERLERAAATDTTRLKRIKLDAAPDQSAEGGETVAYFDCKQPRVIVITYFGETGRAIVRYYLADRDHYLVEREKFRYKQPISVQSRPVLLARIPSAKYVCGKNAVDPVSPDDLAHARSALESTLADLRTTTR